MLPSCRCFSQEGKGRAEGVNWNFCVQRGNHLLKFCESLLLSWSVTILSGINGMKYLPYRNSHHNRKWMSGNSIGHEVLTSAVQLSSPNRYHQATRILSRYYVEQERKP